MLRALRALWSVAWRNILIGGVCVVSRWLVSDLMRSGLGIGLAIGEKGVGVDEKGRNGDNLDEGRPGFLRGIMQRVLNKQQSCGTG